MEVVLQGQVPVASGELYSCQVSPSCAWMATQKAAHGPVQVWGAASAATAHTTTTTTPATAADAATGMTPSSQPPRACPYRPLMELPPTMTHFFLSDSGGNDPHSFLLSTEAASPTAAASECLVTQSVDGAVKLLLNVDATERAQQQRASPLLTEPQPLLSEHFQPLPDVPAMCQCDIKPDVLFANADAAVDHVQFVPINQHQLLVLAYPHFSLISIDTLARRCQASPVQTIGTDLSWTDVHFNRDSAPLACASQQELLVLHPSHVVEVVDLRSGAVDAVIDLKTCCSMHHDVEWSDVSAEWRHRRLLVAAASDPAVLIVDVPAYFSCYPQHRRADTWLPIARRSEADAVAWQAPPLKSMDDYHEEWMAAVRARADIDNGFTRGSMRSGWAQTGDTARYHQPHHEHQRDETDETEEGHGKAHHGRSDEAVGEPGGAAQDDVEKEPLNSEDGGEGAAEGVADPLNTTVMTTATVHDAGYEHEHPYATLVSTLGTCVSALHVSNTHAVVLSYLEDTGAGSGGKTEVVVLDVLNASVMASLPLSPTTHVASFNPLLLVGPRGLTTLVLDLSQQQLLDQLVMLDRDDVVQHLCTQNGWSNHCYTSQLETSLKYRQIALVTQVLTSITTKEQLSRACEMLVEAVEEAWQFRDYLDFPIKLMDLCIKFISSKLEAHARSGDEETLLQLSAYMARLRNILPSDNDDDNDDANEGHGDTRGGRGAEATTAKKQKTKQQKQKQKMKMKKQGAGEDGGGTANRPSCRLWLQLHEEEGPESTSECLHPQFLQTDLDAIPPDLRKRWAQLGDHRLVLEDALQENRLLQAQVFLAANRLDPALHILFTARRRAMATAYNAALRGQMDTAAAALGSAGIEPEECFAEIVRTTVSADLRERLWGRITTTAPHAAKPLEKAMSLAREIRQLYPTESTASAALERRKEQGLPLMEHTHRFQEMLPSSRTNSTNDSNGHNHRGGTGDTLRLGAGAGDSLARDHAFVFSLQTLMDLPEVARRRDADSADGPRSREDHQDLRPAAEDGAGDAAAAAAAPSPLYSQLRLDFLDHMSSDSVLTLAAEAALTRGERLPLENASADALLAQWRVVRDACMLEKLAPLASALAAVWGQVASRQLGSEDDGNKEGPAAEGNGEANSAAGGAASSLMQGMDVYTRLGAQEKLHAAGLYPLAHAARSDRDVRYLARQLWRSGAFFARGSRLEHVPAPVIEAVHQHVTSLVVDNNFLLLGLLLSRAGSWSWPRGTPLESINTMNFETREQIARYLQIQITNKAVADQGADSNSGSGSGSEDEVEEPTTTADLCQRLLQSNCLSSLLMLSAVEPEALDAVADNPEVSVLLRAMNPPDPTRYDGTLLLSLLHAATGIAADGALRWIAATPSGTSRASDTDNNDNEAANTQLREQHEHWFVRRELPSFDSPELKRFALQDHLDFVFYLQQGRPLFALQLFRREQRGVLTNADAARIHCVVLSRPTHTPGVSGALAFLSQLGREDIATYIRQDVQVAKRLINMQAASTRTKADSLEEEHLTLLASLFESWLDSNSSTAEHHQRASRLLVVLSRATRLLVQQQRGESGGADALANRIASGQGQPTAADAIESWDLVLMVSRRHNVIVVPEFLGTFDASQQWLYLTAYAQFYSVQPQHVVEVVQRQMAPGPTKEHVLATLYRHLQTETATALPTVVVHPHYTIPDTSDPHAGGLHLIDYLQLARDATQATADIAIPDVLLALAFGRLCPTMALLASCYGATNLRYICLLVWLLTHLRTRGRVSLDPKLQAVEAEIVQHASGIATLHISSDRGFALCVQAFVLYVELGLQRELLQALRLFSEEAYLPAIKVLELASRHEEDRATAALTQCAKSGLGTLGTWDGIFLAFLQRSPASQQARAALMAAIRSSSIDVHSEDLRQAVQQDACRQTPEEDGSAEAVVRRLINARDFESARASAQRHRLDTSAVNVAEGYALADKMVAIKAGSVHEENTRDDSLARAIIAECEQLFAKHGVNAATQGLFFISLVREAHGAVAQHLPYARHVEGIRKAADEALLLSKGLCCVPPNTARLRSAVHQAEVLMWRRRLEVQAHIIATSGGGSSGAAVVALDEAEAPPRRGWRTEEARANKDPARFYCPQRLPSRSPTNDNRHLPATQEPALLLLLKALLSKGGIGRALHLSSLFEFYHPDLVAVQLSVFLAWETWTPGEAHPLAEEHLGLTFRESSVEDCLQALADATTIGSSCCARVLTNYRMAKMLQMPLQSLFVQEALKILRCAARTETINEELVREFTLRNELPKADVAEALASVFLDAVQGQASARAQWDEETFLNYARLCGDQILFGHKLLELYERRLAREREDISVETPLVAEAELEVLSRAYSCFAKLCHMEGLQRVRTVLQRQLETFTAQGNVLALCQFLVRVRNIREFEFVIEHLYQEQHFEQLLRRGMSHLDEQTKLDFQSFLRDFIERQPASHYKAELQEILPIFFDVSADLGAMLMEKAERILSDFIPHNMHSPKFVDALVMCTETLADAASHFLKAGVPSHARACARKAQLVALQTQYEPQLLALSHEQARKRMRTLPSFGACRVLGEHYFPDVGQHKYYEAIFHNVIVVPGMIEGSTASTSGSSSSLHSVRGREQTYWEDVKRYTTLTQQLFGELFRQLKEYLKTAQVEDPRPFRMQFALILEECPYLTEVRDILRAMPDLATPRLKAHCNNLSLTQVAGKATINVTPSAFAAFT